MHEFELKFQVLPERRQQVEAAMRRGAARQQQLRALYFDTPARALARARASLRLRQEGRRWVQTAKAQGRGAFDRLEHNVPAPARARQPDLGLHAGTPLGDALRAALAATGEDAGQLALLFETDVVRLARNIRAAGSSIELAFDVGRMRAGASTLPVLELEFELIEGSPQALLELAGEWCRRHGLWLDPQSKAHAGHRLAEGTGAVPATRASPAAGRPGGGRAVLARALEAGVMQVLANAREVATGQDQPEHIHQLRVGLRQLRTVLREFDSLAPVEAAAAEAEPALTALFRQLGTRRDQLALVPALHAGMSAAGAPPMTVAPPQALPDAAVAVRDAAVQCALLRVIALQHAVQDLSRRELTRKALRQIAARRLRKLHGATLGSGEAFDGLAPAQRHRMRKRIKRLRYLAEAVRPLFKGRDVDRFLDTLKDLQDSLGQYQDAVTGRTYWEERAQADPRAWFGVGWLAERTEALARTCTEACRDAASKARPFWD